MTENFKSIDLDKKVRIHLLLLCRVLIMRLTTETLNESLRKLWPNLLLELVSIFENKNSKDKDNNNLIVEAIKLIELLSFLNLEDF